MRFSNRVWERETHGDEPKCNTCPAYATVLLELPHHERGLLLEHHILGFSNRKPLKSEETD